MRLIHHLVAVLAFATAPHAAMAASDPDAPARVIVLGVDHAVQLVAENDRPGLLAAFIERVAPDAICVERAPEPFARGNMYEFTYEIQDVALPYAHAHDIAVCPFDWEPSYEDQMLGWEGDFSTPPEVRKPEGFQGFLSFPQPEKLQRSLFSADDRTTLAEVERWATTPAPEASRDLPRRMYLYRTFMQARRIAEAARQRPGQTLLVVVGEFHKYDIEAILAGDPWLQVVQPSSIDAPTVQQAERATTRAQRVAIASFNLLGVQAETGNVDWDWVGRELQALERERRDAETALLRTRYELLTGRIDDAAAAARYRDIAADADAARGFTWDGVRDRSRVDSYFDPFGNLRIDQRARLERARVLQAQGENADAQDLLDGLRSELTPRQARQLEAYWRRALAPAADGPGG